MTTTIISTFVVVLLCLNSKLTNTISYNFPDTWDLPVIPLNFDELIKQPFQNKSNNYNNKQIPQNFWIAFKDVPPENERPAYLNKMLWREQNNSWNLFLSDNNNQLLFMETYYPNTSILYAFKLIHPAVRNSAADIWRFCVLYAFGGVYMDDDSFIDVAFDDIIKPEDSFIASQEGNAYHDDCYRPNYNLSNHHLHLTYNTTIFHSFFGNRNLVSWALFSKPKHELLVHILEEIVNILRHEYIYQSLLKIYPYDAKWKICMCATGPIVLTAVARKLLLEHTLKYGNHENFPLKVVKKDYMDYGGNYKVLYFELSSNPNHYMNYMNKHNIKILSSYIPLSYDILNNLPISKDGRHNYLMKNGTKYLIQDFDTFLSLNYRLYHVVILDSEYFDTIPTGEPLPKIDFQGDWREPVE